MVFLDTGRAAPVAGANDCPHGRGRARGVNAISPNRYCSANAARKRSRFARITVR
jgi:hypothetical protein